MDPERIITEVAKRHGVLLDRDDPVLMVNTMLDLHTADRLEREDNLAQRDANLVALLSQVLDRAEKHAGGQLASTAAGELPRAVDRMVLQRFRWWFAVAGVWLVLAVVAGFGAGWWYRGPAQIVAGITGGTPRCDDQPDGSRLCWIPVFERPAPLKATP